MTVTHPGGGADAATALLVRDNGLGGIDTIFGLPGIARILESLPDDARGHAFIEVRDGAEELPLARPPGIGLNWLHRQGAPAGTTSLLPDAVRGLAWPADRQEVFVWGGCEHRAFRDIHRHLKQEVGLSPRQQVLYSHWHRALSEEQIIEIGGDEMRGRADDLHAALVRLMIRARTLEARQEAVVDVDAAAREVG